MTEKSELGKKGEDFACSYLVEKDYKILERNYRRKWGELDIVAMAPDKTLVFVEVKTMSGSNRDLKPEDQMTAAKLKKFRRTASLYAGEHEELIRENKGWRLDLIAMVIDGEEPKIEHYENIP